MKIKQNNRFKIKNIELIRRLKEGDKLVDKYFWLRRQIRYCNDRIEELEV